MRGGDVFVNFQRWRLLYLGFQREEIVFCLEIPRGNCFIVMQVRRLAVYVITEITKA